MPRRNNNIPIRRTIYSSPTNKKRYNSKTEAEKAANYAMLLNLNLKLTVYKDIDGGWYLTSKNKA